MMKKLTILLTLKDRSVYTKRWFESNVFPEFNYFIADGSFGEENKKICKNYISSNVEYVRYRPDSTYKIYIQKRLDALKKINTRFVMFADNDDFILREGLLRIMKDLESDPAVSLAQGKVGTVTSNNEGLFAKSADWPHFLKNGRSNEEKFMDFFVNSYSLFYSVSETKIQKRIFQIFQKSKTENPYIVEEFQTFFSIVLSKSKSMPYYYYVRQVGSEGSMHQIFANIFRFDLCINESFNKSFIFLISQLSKSLVHLSYIEIFNLVREYQISKFNIHPLRLRSHVIQVIRLKSTLLLANIKFLFCFKTTKLVSHKEIVSLYT